ncbi:MAG: DUF2232 domain-containing protein [Desulfocucumaceae bacterium]
MLLSFFIRQRVVDVCFYTAALLIPALAAVYVPVLSMLAVILMPILLALLVRKTDWLHALGALFLMSLICGLLTGNPQAVLFLALQSGPLGILLGLLTKLQVSSGKTLLLAMGFSLLISAGLLLSVILLTGDNPFVLNNRDSAVFDQFKNELAFQGGTGADPARVREIEMMVSWLESLWPVIAVSSAIIWVLVSSLATFFIARLAMVRLGYSVPPALPFSRWRLPWYVIWGVIVGLALLLAGEEASISGMTMAGKIILLVMGFILSVLGAATGVYFLRRWRVARWIKLAVVVGLVFFPQVTVPALITLGLVDAFLNIRRLSPDGRIPEEEDKK